MSDKKDLGVFEDGELVPIQPVCSGLTRCCRCNVELTPENNSGWEVFVSPTRTAPVCKECNVERCSVCGAPMTKENWGAFLKVSDDTLMMFCKGCYEVEKRFKG